MANIFTEWTSKIQEFSEDIAIDKENTDIEFLKPLDLRDNFITNVRLPVQSHDAVNKEYVDTSISNAINGYNPAPPDLSNYYTKAETNTVISDDLQPVNTNISTNSTNISNLESSVSTLENTVSNNLNSISTINNSIEEMETKGNKLIVDVSQNILDISNLTGAMNDISVQQANNTLQITDNTTLLNGGYTQLKTLTLGDEINNQPFSIKSTNSNSIFQIITQNNEPYFSSNSNIYFSQIGYTDYALKIDNLSKEVDIGGNLNVGSKMIVNGISTFNSSISMNNTSINDLVDNSSLYSATTRGYVNNLCNTTLTDAKNYTDTQISNIPASVSNYQDKVFKFHIRKSFYGNGVQDYGLYNGNFPSSLTGYNSYIYGFAQCFNYTNESFTVYWGGYNAVISPHKNLSGSIVNNGSFYIEGQSKTMIKSGSSEYYKYYGQLGVVGNGSGISSNGNIQVDLIITLVPAPPDSNTMEIGY